MIRVFIAALFEMMANLGDSGLYGMQSVLDYFSKSHGHTFVNFIIPVYDLDSFYSTVVDSCDGPTIKDIFN